ncbi:alpha-isopropylmalate synthase regulatory domain-containing protein [Streptomyces sp. NPDC055681]
MGSGRAKPGQRGLRFGPGGGPHRGSTEHATGTGQRSPAMAYVECRVDGAVRWGAGQDTSVLTASIPAVLSAVNRRV